MHQIHSTHAAHRVATSPNSLSLGLSLICAFAVACAAPPTPVVASTTQVPTATTPSSTSTSTPTAAHQDHPGEWPWGEGEEYEPWTETWPAEDTGVRHRRPKRTADAGVAVAPEPMPGVSPPIPVPLKADSAPAKPEPRALTAMDQGSSPAELAITTSIRKQMMVSKELTFGAKNTKVITTGDRVTLRGYVATAAERTLIEGLARRTPGVRDVDCKLEVKK